MEKLEFGLNEIIGKSSVQNGIESIDEIYRFLLQTMPESSYAYTICSQYDAFLSGVESKQVELQKSTKMRRD